MKRLLSERHNSKPQIVVTNLIDVVLLLVFFFMITSSFANNKEQVPVNIPKAANSASAEKENMTVQISKEGKIYIAGKITSDDELKDQIKTWILNSPERPILVEADEESEYGQIVSILDTMRSSGAFNIGLATKPKE